MNDNASVLMTIEKNIARIVLNNPQNGNVVNNENLSLMLEFLETANNDHRCKVIVIEGKDKVFCKGMDFKNLLGNLEENKKIDIEFSSPYKNVIKSIRNSNKPVIAKVDGEVVAGGMGILLACDIIIASKTSTFCLSEVLFGIIPAYIFPLLLERISYKRSRFLILSSITLDGEDALRYGIVDEIGESEDLNKIEKKYTKRLSFASSSALSFLKKYSEILTDNKMDQYLDYAQRQLTELLNDNQNIDRIKKFMNGGRLDRNEWTN